MAQRSLRLKFLLKNGHTPRSLFAKAHTQEEDSLQRAIREYVEHDHRERNHQGRNDVLLFPSMETGQKKVGPIQC